MNAMVAHLLADRPLVSKEDRWRDGDGLGLAIVTKAMRAQNGSLEICGTIQGAKLALNFLQ